MSICFGQGFEGQERREMEIGDGVVEVDGNGVLLENSKKGNLCCEGGAGPDVEGWIDHGCGECGWSKLRLQRRLELLQ